MEIIKVEENINKLFRNDDELTSLFPCDVCGEPGFIEIKGDIEYMGCNNTITLCRGHMRGLIEDLTKLVQKLNKLKGK